MDYDEWAQEADELLSRLEAKYGPTSPPTCSELITRLNRLLQFLHERSADAWQTRKLDELLERVEILARDTPPDAAAIDQADIEYYEVTTADDRLLQADHIVGELDTLDAISHGLKMLEEKRKSGAWTKDDEVTYAAASEFRNSIIKKLRESNVPFDDRAS